MSIFGSLLGGFGGFLGSELSNQLNSARSLHSQRSMVDYTDQRQRAFIKDQYSLQREGLEKAGYNPMLAVGSSASSEALQAGSGFAGENSAASMIQGALAKSQVDINDAQKQNLTDRLDLDNRTFDFDKSKFSDQLSFDKSKFKDQLELQKKQLSFDMFKWKMEFLLNSAKTQEEIGLLHQNYRKAKYDNRWYNRGISNVSKFFKMGKFF